MRRLQRQARNILQPHQVFATAAQQEGICATFDCIVSQSTKRLQQQQREHTFGLLRQRQLLEWIADLVLTGEPEAFFHGIILILLYLYIHLFTHTYIYGRERFMGSTFC